MNISVAVAEPPWSFEGDGESFKFALNLMYMKGLTKKSKIPVRSAEMERFGLSPKTRRVQLAKLEEADLEKAEKAEKAVGQKTVVTAINFFPLQNFSSIVIANQ